MRTPGLRLSDAVAKVVREEPRSPHTRRPKLIVEKAVGGRDWYGGSEVTSSSKGLTALAIGSLQRVVF
jgi:hypothetical protein